MRGKMKFFALARSMGSADWFILKWVDRGLYQAQLITHRSSSSTCLSRMLRLPRINILRLLLMVVALHIPAFVEATSTSLQTINKNKSIQRRLDKMSQKSYERKPEGPKAVKRYIPPSCFSKILSGDLNSASIRDLHHFIDHMRDETKRLAKTRPDEHPKDCVCMDHLSFDLIRTLARLTGDHPSYGASVMVRPSAWQPPVFLAAMQPVDSHEMAFMYTMLASGFATILFITLAIYLTVRFSKARKARLRAADAEASQRKQVEQQQEALQKGFDITRVDMLE